MGLKIVGPFKRNLWVLAGCFVAVSGYAQTNSFPNSGNVGIGTTNPLSPLDIRKMRVADKAHVIFGSPTTALGEVASSLTFAGWGIMHSGFSWIPRTGPDGKLILSFGGSEAPELNTAAVTFMAKGNVGIAVSDPQHKLDVGGNLLLRNLTNQGGAGAVISFSSFGGFDPGPRIRSYLDYASGPQSSSRLILSSYNSGYEDELTLMQGKVGIGTLNPSDKLSVNGNIRAREIKVENGNWPDYVFEPSYKSASLMDIEQFIKENKHLPDIPSAKDVQKDGVNLGEMNAKLLKKIEEMTLYLIEQHKRLDKLQAEIDDLKKAD